MSVPSPYNSSPSFPACFFCPHTPPHKPQLHQLRLTAVIQPQFISTKQDLTMPPIPIIAPQPRRLLPQPTIIDTSAPVLPINLDDPFIVSVSSCLCLPYQRTHLFLTQVPHPCPQECSASTPHVSNSHSPSYQALFGLFSFHLAASNLPFISLLSFFKASQSPTPCSSIKRQVGCPPRTPRRRRHNIRPEAIIAPRVINFDSLPWISTLDDPVLTAGNPWDSDLSALASAEYMRVSGLGPVRRRKFSSRDRTEPPVPLVSTPPNAMSTPPPRFPSPSRVQFIGLMPIMTPAQEAAR